MELADRVTSSHLPERVPPSPIPQIEPRSLHGRLIIAFVLVLLIPTVVISAYSQWRTREALLVQAAGEQLQLAQARADAAEGQINHAAADLLFAVQNPALRDIVAATPPPAGATERHFAAFLRDTAGRYSGICLLDTAGRELACVRGSREALQAVAAAQLADRHAEPFFVNALARAGIPGDGGVEISAVDSSSGEPLIRYSTMIARDDGTSAGVVVLEAPAERVFALLRDASATVRTTLVKPDGRFLLFRDQYVAAGPTLFSEQPNDAAIVLRQQAGVILDSADRPGQFQTFSRIRPTGQSALQWTVIYEQPLDGLLRDVRQIGLVNLGITLVALLAALVVANLLARDIVRPVEALAAAAGQVGSGDLHAPIPRGGSQEIAALGAVLDRTVAHLREAVETAEGRRREAEALSEANARLAAILEATTDIVAMCSFDGEVLFLNRAGRQLLGLAADDPLPDKDRAMFYSPETLAMLQREALPAVVHDGIWSGEGAVVDSSGRSLPVSQVIIAHRTTDGTPVYMSTILRDLSERRRAEEELRQSQKMEALGRLAGGLAHDFNNLLTVIMGECDLMLDELPKDGSSYRSAEQIRQSGARAAALTRQLLAFSRRQILNAELIDLNEVVSGMDQLLRRLLGEDVALAFALAPDLPTVRADAGQIEQVLMNLAINGRDAMPEGGSLAVATRAEWVGPADRARPEIDPGLYAVIAVCDTGVGIEPETRAHIFEPFFTTKPRGKGTGLGLATVHGIVRQSGGFIWFASEIGQGTVFEIYLPAAQGTPTRSQDEPPPALQRAAAQTVLLVEDDEHVRSLAHMILARAGFTVLEAADGPTAVALARDYAGTIDLLLSDVVLPGGRNGVQVAREVRNLRPVICVVYMSGYTDNALVGRSMADEGAGYIQKPFTAHGLVSSLCEALARGGSGRV